MKKIKVILLLGMLVALSVSTIYAQSETNFPKKEWRLGLAYFGETLLRPGFSIAADYPMLQWDKTKAKTKGNKFRSLALHLGTRYWNYRQPVSHVGNALDFELFLRRTKSFDYKNKIGIFDFGITAGYGWNKLMGGIYKTTDKGFEKGSKRQSFFSYGFFASFGSDLTKKKNFPLQWYVKPKIVIETPYAPFPQIHPVLEIGISLPLK